MRAAGRPLGPELSGFSSALANYFDLRALPHVGFGLLHGRSGSAKTAAATAIALSCKVPAMIIESEMRPVRILERITASMTGTHIGDLLNGKLSADQIADLMADVVAKTPLVAMLDATTTTLSAQEIGAYAASWRKRHMADHVLVVLDSLQSWSSRALCEIRDEYPRTNTAIDQIMIAAAWAKAFFLVVSERSNAAGENADAAHGKGSGRSGYAGEVTLGLDAAGKYDSATGRVPLNLTIAKNRWGAQYVTVPLWFEGRLQRFTDAAEPHRKAISPITRRRTIEEKIETNGRSAHLDQEPEDAA